MANVSLVTDMLSQVDQITQTYVFNGYSALSDYMKPVVYSLYTLTVILFGYSNLTGQSDLSFAEVSKRILIAGIVTMLALNWHYFSDYVVKMFVDVPNEISMKLMTGVSKNTDIHTITSALDKFFKEGQAISAQICKQGAWNNVMPYFIAFCVWILCSLLTGIALFFLITAKICLSIFLVLAPVMISSWFFKPTKALLFDGWLSGLTGFALMPIFTYATLSFILLLLEKLNIKPDPNQYIDLVHASMFIVFLGIGIGLLIKANQMATSIAGSYSGSGTKEAAKGAGLMIKGIKKLFGKKN